MFGFSDNESENLLQRWLVGSPGPSTQIFQSLLWALVRYHVLRQPVLVSLAGRLARAGVDHVLRPAQLLGAAVRVLWRRTGYDASATLRQPRGGDDGLRAHLDMLGELALWMDEKFSLEDLTDPQAPYLAQRSVVRLAQALEDGALVTLGRDTRFVSPALRQYLAARALAREPASSSKLCRALERAVQSVAGDQLHWTNVFALAAELLEPGPRAELVARVVSEGPSLPASWIRVIATQLGEEPATPMI